MAVTDPIANMLTQLRNASRAKKEKINIPNSKITCGIAAIMKKEGYIDNYRLIKDNKQGLLRIYLKYLQRKSVIINLKRVSRPGLRVYAGVEHLPRVLRDKGFAILTTSSGLMTNKEAKEKNIGGEILCYIW